MGRKLIVCENNPWLLHKGEVVEFVADMMPGIIWVSTKDGDLCVVEEKYVKPFSNKKTDGIKSILVNKNKKIITVLFEDGTEIVKCSENDDFDVNIGVALAIAQHIYGSKAAFHKAINSKVKIMKGSKK